MRDFAPWLFEASKGDAELAKLQKLSEGRADWPFFSNELSAFASFLNANLPEASRAELSTVLGVAFERWRAAQAEAQRSGRFDGLFANVGAIALIFFGLVMAGFLIAGLLSAEFRDALAVDA